MSAGEVLRGESDGIAARWANEVTHHVPELATIDRFELIDHLPQFIEGLAGWMDGDMAAATAGFCALAEGHAVSRRALGISLASLITEYATLRRVIFDTLRPHLTIDDVAPLNNAMDEAVTQAVLRYTSSCDEVRERFIAILAHDLRDPL